MVKPEDVILDEIDKFMDNYIDRVFQLSQEALVTPHTKIFKSGKSINIITTDTSNLLKSGNVNRKFLEKEIVYSAPYASDIEFGSNGSIVSPSDLDKWVRRKLLKNKRASDKTVLRISTNIARSLKARGHSPDPYITPAFEQANIEFGLKV